MRYPFDFDPIARPYPNRRIAPMAGDRTRLVRWQVINPRHVPPNLVAARSEAIRDLSLLTKAELCATGENMIAEARGQFAKLRACGAKVVDAHFKVSPDGLPPLVPGKDPAIINPGIMCSVQKLPAKADQLTAKLRNAVEPTQVAQATYLEQSVADNELFLEDVFAFRQWTVTKPRAAISATLHDADIRLSPVIANGHFSRPVIQAVVNLEKNANQAGIPSYLSPDISGQAHTDLAQYYDNVLGRIVSRR